MMNLKNMYVEWKKQEATVHIVYDSIYIRHPKRANLQK